MTTPQCKQCFLFQDSLSNGPPFGVLHEGRYWRLSHAYPASMPGWLILQAKTHQTALHLMTLDEYLELGLILDCATKALQELTRCEKQHCVSVGDGMYGNHVTFHIIPRREGASVEYDDFSLLFACLSPNEQTCLSRDDVALFCLKFAKILEL